MKLLVRRASGSDERKMNRSIQLWAIFLLLIALTLFWYTAYHLHSEHSKAKLRLKKTAQFMYRQQDTTLLNEVKEITNHDDINKYLINLTMIKNESDLASHQDGYRLHAFNQMVSDRIGPHSSLAVDYRSESCKTRKFHAEGRTSIVICFYNEALSVLLRTISSIFKKTPPQYLKEVIVVDDGSIQEYAVDIEQFVADNYLGEKLHMLRSDKQLGLIRARMFGARHATGDVLVFLDSHCEVTEGWIEPLLFAINTSRSSVVSPVVDSIDPNTFQYTTSDLMRGGFNWGLHFSWEPVPSSVKVSTDAFPTPTISGGLFAVDREFFFKLGGYDEQMVEWGAENLEISFRTWMCGGRMAIAPCSRVGHVFRQRRPYGFGSNASFHNSLRLARVWMDSYQQYFKKSPSSAAGDDVVGDVRERVELRKSLRCKDFEWYLNTVYPEIEIPGVRKSSIHYSYARRSPKPVARGQVKVHELPICLLGLGNRGTPLTAGECDDAHQSWTHTSTGEIQFSNKLCLDSSSLNPRLMKCDGSGGSQKWMFITSQYKSSRIEITGKLYNPMSGLCLSVNQDGESFEVAMRICLNPSVQKFTIPAL